MELPTPAPQGRKPTHDFLSKHTATNSSQDTTTTTARPPPASFLTTQNFLQPLEVPASKADKPAATSHILKAPSTSSVEHILPGGIGTYTISHVSCIPKPDVSIFTVAQATSNDIINNDDNSNSSSQTGSGFALWEQSAVNNGIKANENYVGHRKRIARDPAPKLMQWSAERQSQSSFNQRGGFAPASSSQLPVQNTNNNRSFMDLFVATNSKREDLEDCEADFVIKKEGSPSDREDYATRTEGKTAERKANTPRSKHSATEQRRRSKINDRFQMLREIIPHSDQKRDKASFLLEAIEYIRYLQEKVQRYEGSFPGWNHESAKQIPSRNKCQPAQGFLDNCAPIHGGSSATPILSVKMSDKNIGTSSTIPRDVIKQGDSEIISPIVVRPIPSQSKIFVESSGKSNFPPILVSDTEKGNSQRTQHGDVRQCKSECAVPNDELRDQDVAIEGGTINISTAYSQGFLNKLTQSLQGLGVDLSDSRISVQIDLGKQNKLKLCNPETMKKVDDLNPTSQVKANSILPCTSDYSDQPAKRLRTVVLSDSVAAE